MVETEQEIQPKVGTTESLPDPNFERERNYDLPDGWKKKIVRRMTGKSAEGGRAWDVYLIPPTGGKRLRSVVDLMKYLQANPHIPINASVVNMERTSDVTGNSDKSLSSSTVKLIEFVEKLRNGEMVNIEEFLGRQSKPSTAMTAVMLPGAPHLPQAKGGGGSGRGRKPKNNAAIQPSFVLSNQPMVDPILATLQLQNQISLIKKSSLSESNYFQPFLMGKTVFSPFENFGSKHPYPFTGAQLVKLETLVSECEDLPTPDKISEWSSEVGVRYTDLQEWIRQEWFFRKNGNSCNYDDDEVLVEDDEDPLADDDGGIVPAQLCNVVMDD